MIEYDNDLFPSSIYTGGIAAMNKNNPEGLKAIRTAVCLVLVIMYFLGLVFMMTGLFYAGMTLWALSTIGGIGLLYYIRTTEKTQKAVEEALKEEAKLDSDAEPEASDDSCE